MSQQKQQKVSLWKLVGDVKLSREVLKESIKTKRIKGAGPDGIPLGLYDILIQQTKEHGGTSNLLTLSEAAEFLQIGRIYLEDIVHNGVNTLPVPLDGDSHLQYFSHQRTLRFKDNVFVKHEIPAKYSSDNRKFQIGPVYIRKDAVQEISPFLKKKTRQKQAQSITVIVSEEMQPAKNLPLIFYNQDLGVAIYMEQDNDDPNKVRDILKVDKPSDFSARGVYPKLKVTTGNLNGTSYLLFFLQISSPPAFERYFENCPFLIGIPWQKEHIISRLTWDFFKEKIKYSYIKKPDWFETMILLYQHQQKRAYKK
jgi:hypothetical protein